MSYYTKKRKFEIKISPKAVLINLFVLLMFVSVIVMLCYIPKLRNRFNPNDLRTQFLSEATDFREAFRLMQQRNFEFETIDKSRRFGRKFSGFFKLDGICDDIFEACLWNNLTYRTLDGEILPIYFGTPNVGQFRTRSGALYMIYKNDNDLWVFVDVNGIKKKPNRFGIDVFGFYIDEDGSSLRVMGASGTPFQSISLYCNPAVSNKYNGMSCPIKALMDNDYFTDTIKTLY